MKKATRIITMLVIALLIASTAATIVFAYDPSNVTATQPSDTVITDMGNRIFGIVQVVGIIISVVWLAVLGIKYMMGSTEEKAEYKEKLMPYIIGCFVTFAAFGIWKVVLVMLQNSGI